MLITGELKAKHGVRVDTYGPTGTPENDSNPILGYIEPACEDAQWILWFSKNGDAVLYTERDYSNGHTGAVIGEPIRLKARKSQVVTEG